MSELTTADTSLNAPAPPAEPEPSLLVGRGYWPRAVAYLIDTVVFLLMFYGIAMASGAFVGFVYALLDRDLQLNTEAISDLISLLIFGIFPLYFVLCEWLGGATIGKLLLGLRVVARDGRPCSLGAALLRAIIHPFDSFFFGLPAVFSMREPFNQRLGDRAANTLVVTARSPHLPASRRGWGTPLAVALWAACTFFALTLIMLLTVVV